MSAAGQSKRAVITAGTPPWTDTNTDVPSIGLQLGDLAGGGFPPPIIGA